MAFTFEKLIIYQKAVDFADKICSLTGTFPNGYYFLRDQLNRASLSIASQHAARSIDISQPQLYHHLTNGSAIRPLPLSKRPKMHRVPVPPRQLPPVPLSARA